MSLTPAETAAARARIALALTEDVGAACDRTSLATIPAEAATRELRPRRARPRRRTSPRPADERYTFRANRRTAVTADAPAPLADTAPPLADTAAPRRAAHDARAIANYFLDLGERDGVPLDLLKLQHLIYFAHGWHLALRDEPLVYQTIVAQPDGPAVRDVENEFEDYLDGNISGRATIPADGQRTFEAVPLRADLSAASAALVNRTWEQFKGYTSGELLDMSTLSDDPWDCVAGDKPDEEIDDLPIPNSLIRERFIVLRNQRRANAAR